MTALPAAAVRPLRLAVLRPGGGPEDVVWPGDDDPATLHAGVLGDENRPLAVGTLVPEPAPAEVDWDGAAWRVRGMATAPEQRGRGLGTAVLAALLDHAERQGGGLVWCHARVAALPLYARAGFEPVGEPYLQGPLGLHRLMVRRP